MTRTVIAIPEEERAWLRQYSRRHRQSVAETVRQAIRSYRENAAREARLDHLRQTAGIWKDRGIDGLAYVTELRDEWEARGG